MKITINDPPRIFRAGSISPVSLADCGSILLSPEEQITFQTEDGAQYDVTRKDWGFYATPSINGRLLSYNLRTALCKNGSGKHFVLLVEQEKTGEFLTYLELQDMELLEWLDER